MTQTIRLFLLIEGVVFVVAALTHFGVLIEGYEHREAGTAEAVIGAVLLAGLTVSLIRPRLTRIAGLISQVFALIGTLVGIFTIIIGVGPQTAPDIIYHVAIIIVLVWSLILTAQASRQRA